MELVPGFAALVHVFDFVQFFENVVLILFHYNV